MAGAILTEAKVGNIPRKVGSQRKMRWLAVLVVDGVSRVWRSGV